MFFDEQHYLRVHVPLVERQLEGRVAYVRMAVEFGVTLQLDAAVVRSPCVFHLYVRTEDDVRAFRDFRQGPHVAPLREDLPKYTNCTNEWTVSRYVEAQPAAART